MKSVLVAAGVPTAGYGVFSEAGAAGEYLRSLPGPWVVKTDGLAAGKGVLVTDDLDAALADVEGKLNGAAFGAAGRRVVVEEWLSGPEVSILAVCDGRRAVALAPAQDFKRAGDGDTGANTGGMGAYSPVPGVGPEVVESVMAAGRRPHAGRAAVPRDRLPRHSVRRTDADAVGTLRAGVQRPLRRSRDAGGPPPLGG